MKKILLAIFSLISIISYSQTTGYFRYDTVRIQKVGANSTLIIENATRDTLGFLYNYSGGRTRFERPRAVTGGIKFGNDTVLVGGEVTQSALDDTASAIRADFPAVGSGGISEVIAGYGLLNVNDSTLDVDSLVIANRDWVMDRISEIDTANLIAMPLGSTGIGVLSPVNDTLYYRKLVGSTYVDVDTLVTGELEVSLPITGTPDGTKFLRDDMTWQTSADGGITTLNTLTGATQTFATGTTGSDFNIGSTGTTHTFNIPDAGTAVRGVVTTGTQSFAGQKTYNGLSIFTGNFQTNTNIATSNLFAVSATAGSSSSSVYQLKGSTSVGIRAGMAGSTNYTIGTGFSYGSFIQGIMPVTESTTGTHPLIAGIAFNPLGVTNGGATTTDMTTVYIAGPPTGTATPTNPATSLFVDDGISRFDGMFASGATSLTANQIWGSNSGATAMEGKTLTNGQNIKITHGAGTATFAGATLTKSPTIEIPGAAENIWSWKPGVAITITDVHAVLVGSSSPSVTYNIKFDTDRSAAGTSVYTSNQTVTSVTTGTSASGVNDATIPAGSIIWIITSAQSGTVNQLGLTITYTED